MADVALLQFSNLLHLPHAKLDRLPQLLKEDAAICESNTPSLLPPTDKEDAQLFHAELAQNLENLRTPLIGVLAARKLVVQHMTPQLVYDLENNSTKPEQPVFWLGTSDAEFDLHDTLKALGIKTFTTKEKTSALTPEARDWLLRAYRIQQCERSTKKGWLATGVISARDLDEFDTLAQQIDRFLANPDNAHDWELIVRNSRRAASRKLQHHKQQLSDAKLLGDPLVDVTMVELLPNDVDRRKRMDRAVLDTSLADSRQDPRYVLQLERGRTNIEVYRRADPRAHGPMTVAGQDQFELQENLADYDDQIYNLLLLRTETGQCARCLSGLAKDDRTPMIGQWREKLIARGQSVGIEIFSSTPTPAGGISYQLTATGETFLKRVIRAHDQEKARGIGTDMTDYEERRQLFLSDFKNAPDWALLVEAHAHQRSEERRVKLLATLDGLIKYDELVKRAFRSAAEQAKPELEPAYWFVIDHIEAAGRAVGDIYYHSKLVAELRGKLNRLVEIINLYDVRTHQVLGLSSDTHAAPVYSPEYLTFNDKSSVVIDERLNLLMDPVPGLQTPDEYIRMAPLSLIRQTVSVLARPAFVQTHERRFDIPLWASKFWDVTPPSMSAYKHESNGIVSTPKPLPPKSTGSTGRPARGGKDKFTGGTTTFIDYTTTSTGPGKYKFPDLDTTIRRITEAEGLALEAKQELLARAQIKALIQGVETGSSSGPDAATAAKLYDSFNIKRATNFSPTPKSDAELSLQWQAQKERQPAAEENAKKLIGALLLGLKNL